MNTATHQPDILLLQNYRPESKRCNYKLPQCIKDTMYIMIPFVVIIGGITLICFLL